MARRADGADPLRLWVIRALLARVQDGVVDSGDLHAEARIFGRYLGGRVPPPELIDRYVDANRILRPAAAAAGAVPARDAAVLGFIRRHPWSVPYLDAGAGLLDRDGLLRSKLLVMTAILEASPAFAEEFLPRPSGRLSMAVRLTVLGAVLVAQVSIGVALHVALVRAGARTGPRRT